MHFRLDPLQPGPIYFPTNWKCLVFGMSSDVITRKMNFNTDDSVETGKGVNAVVSRLHCFFENDGLGEETSICMLTTVLERIRTI